MVYILKKSLENISCLIHFYETQKPYIDKKSKKGTKENQLGFLLDFYLSVLVNGTEEEKNRQTFKNLEKLACKYIEVKEVKDYTVIYAFKESKLKEKIDVSTTSSNYKKFAQMPYIHINNTIIMLITRFEDFISDFIKYLYLKYPKKYLDNQTICFSEISQSNLSEIRGKIIDREIDEMMRKSYMDWFDLFKEHNMNLACCKEECNFLTELYATRNVIVHNCGIVNEQYLKNAKFTEYKLGEKVKVDDDFIKKSFECIKTIMLCIMVEGMRLEKDNKDENSDAIFGFAFDELVLNNYNCSKTVFKALYDSPFTNEINKQMSRVNHWIAKIELYGLESVKTEIENFDVSALEPTFLMAKNILLSKYKEATEVLIELCENKKIYSLEFEEWPLFKKYKSTNEYKEFKQMHPELVSTASIDIDDETSMMDFETAKNVKAELNDLKKN